MIEWELGAIDWAGALFAAWCIGLAKTGLAGAAMLNVLIMAAIFGALPSVGIVLPLLIVADLLVYRLFRRHGSWRQVGHFALPAVAGVVIGWWLLSRVSNEQARLLIGSIILAMLGLKLVTVTARRQIQRIAQSAAFHWGCGIAVGVATIVANAAGPISAIYLLVRKTGKLEFLGWSARFYLLINAIKVPFLLQLGLITRDSLTLNLLLVPAVVVGVFSGSWLIRRLPQQWFEWIMLASALLAAVRLLFW
jgi:uncharacterized membrane protein YfcA